MTILGLANKKANNFFHRSSKIQIPQIPISKNLQAGSNFTERTSTRNSISSNSKTTNLHFDKAKPQTLQNRSTPRATKSNFARGTRLTLPLKARAHPVITSRKSTR